MFSNTCQKVHPNKQIAGLVLFLLLALLHVTPALARSDDLIQRDIETQIAESTALRGARIEVHVEQRLVVLSGEVRLYEQKLLSARIAWTTPDVFEVDNEIRVVPKRALTDAAIYLQIQEFVKADERFHTAGVVIRVKNGEVHLQGSFLHFRYPSILKHKVAEIEGVIAIHIKATFLARLYETGE